MRRKLVKWRRGEEKMISDNVKKRDDERSSLTATLPVSVRRSGTTQFPNEFLQLGIIYVRHCSQ